jgi:hypothetical protein
MTKSRLPSLGPAAPLEQAAGPPGRVLQRKCACGRETHGGGECEECRKKREGTLQRSPTTNAEVREVPAVVHDVLHEPGQPLDRATRSVMESRFAHDFSGVRVHTDAVAARSADAVDAEAYTVGADIAFGAGRYAPSSEAGRRLLAHELTHVVQQSGGAPEGPLTVAPAAGHLERDAEASSVSAHAAVAGAAGRAMVQREPKKGTSVYDDSAVSLDPADPKAKGVVSGKVARKEFGDKHALIHEMNARVRFDSQNCTVTVPVRVAFREPTAADFASFKSVNPKLNAKAPPKGVGRKTFDRYVKAVNEGLNGWFAVEFGECKGSPCSGRITRVNVEVTEDATAPDYTVSVVDGGDQGRSAVFPSSNTVVLAGSGGEVGTSTFIHEGGHMALGHGDEYEEEELPGRDKSRVREDDFSRMGEHFDYEGWSVFHERHFAFVPSFLNAAMKSLGTPCTAELKALAKPRFDFEANLTVSGASFTGTKSIGLGLGVGAGLLSTSRNWRGFLELHGSMLASLGDTFKAAFLLGARLGVDRRFTPSSGGVFLGAYAEAGKGYFDVPDATKPDTRDRTRFTAPYGEAGVRAGYGFSPSSGLLVKVFADAAAGSTLNVHDPNQQHWFRAGLGAGLEY